MPRRYTKAVLASEELTFDLNGDTTIHIKGLPATKVHYNKKITMKGTFICSAIPSHR